MDNSSSDLLEEYELIILSESESDEESSSGSARLSECKNEENEGLEDFVIATFPAANPIPNSQSLSMVRGIGGFINDFQTLSLEIKRLKTSEQAWNETLKSKQIQLNKASEEWCTAQAKLAKNEMLIKAQRTQIASLKQQAKNIESRNTTWDMKLNLVSNGLEAMFQSASKLSKQDDNQQADSEDRRKVEQGNQVNTTNDANLQLQLRRPSTIAPPIQSLLVYTGSQQRFGHETSSNNQSSLAKLPFSSKMFQSGYQRNLNVNAVNTKIKLLRAKFSKRMKAKERCQQEIKSQLARKNRLLQNLTQLVHKNRLQPRIRLHKSSMKKIAMATKRLPPPQEQQTNEHGPSSRPPTSVPTRHSRDNTFPVQSGYACTCGMRCKFLGTLHRHLGDGDKKFICDICNMAFLYFSDLNGHLRDKHKKVFPPNTHGCRTCGAVFPNKMELMQGWKHRNGKCIRAAKRNRESS